MRGRGVKSTVQARLDEEGRRNLAQLTRALGWSQSRVVREALRRMAASHPRPGRPPVIGLGRFASGVHDLGSNKNHLKGFGR